MDRLVEICIKRKSLNLCKIFFNRHQTRMGCIRRRTDGSYEASVTSSSGNSFSKLILVILNQQCFLIIRQIPSVFSGHHLVVYGLLKDGANIPKEATLIVHTPDKKVLSIKVPLDPMTTDGSLIHR